jgi:hypothetical protein
MNAPNESGLNLYLIKASRLFIVVSVHRDANAFVANTGGIDYFVLSIGANHVDHMDWTSAALANITANIGPFRTAE